MQSLFKNIINLESCLDRLESGMDFHNTFHLGVTRKKIRNSEFNHEISIDQTDPYSMENAELRIVLNDEISKLIHGGSGDRLSEYEQNVLRGFIVRGLRLMTVDKLWSSIKIILRDGNFDSVKTEREIDVLNVFKSVVPDGIDVGFSLDILYPTVQNGEYNL